MSITAQARCQRRHLRNGFCITGCGRKAAVKRIAGRKRRLLRCKKCLAAQVEAKKNTEA